MMTQLWLAIVRVEDGKIAKYEACTNAETAQAHVARYGGFVWHNKNDIPLSRIVVSEGNKCAPVSTTVIRAAEAAEAEAARFAAWKEAEAAKAEAALLTKFRESEAVR